MKKLILILSLFSFCFSLEFNFHKSSLDSFELQGLSSKIVYKNKKHRDLLIGKLWDKFFSSKDFDFEKSRDKKLYVLYSNYKTNSFDCFIGIKSKESISSFEKKKIEKSYYQKMILEYKNGMNMSDIWDDMQKQEPNRDFRLDIEQYDLMDLRKKNYLINIYLSMKKDK